MMDAIFHFSRKCIAIEERPQNSYVVITCNLWLQGWPDGTVGVNSSNTHRDGRGMWFHESLMEE